MNALQETNNLNTMGQLEEKMSFKEEADGSDERGSHGKKNKKTSKLKQLFSKKKKQEQQQAEE